MDLLKDYRMNPAPLLLTKWHCRLRKSGEMMLPLPRGHIIPSTYRCDKAYFYTCYNNRVRGQTQLLVLFYDHPANCDSLIQISAF